MELYRGTLPYTNCLNKKLSTFVHLFFYQKFIYMKKFLVIIILFISVFRASADEGMWLPMLLGEQVYQDMVKHGLKLTKEQ
jgi:hypothetical protein